MFQTAPAPEPATRMADQAGKAADRGLDPRSEDGGPPAAGAADPPAQPTAAVDPGALSWLGEMYGGPGHRRGAGGGGRPLPPPLQARMGSAFGTDLSDVRVHEGQHVSALGAEAAAQGRDIHFAPGQYDPDSGAGQGLIGHELAHLLQQRAGRVAAPQGKGGELNQDPALEAEADTLGAQAARGESARVPGAGSLPQGGDAPAAPVQAFRRVAPSRYTASSPTTGFLSQRALETGPYSADFPLVSSALPPLLVSNDGRMAIEDTGAEPKVFYADPAIAEESNQRLKDIGSSVKLQVGGKRLDVGGKDLRMVTPTHWVQPDEKELVDGLEKFQHECNRMAALVMGKGEDRMTETTGKAVFESPDRQRKFTPDFDYTKNPAGVAGVFANPAKGLRHLANPPSVTDGSTGQAYGTMFGTAPDQARKRSKKLGVNQHADPEVGESFAIYSVPDSEVQSPSDLAKQLDYTKGVARKLSDKGGWTWHFAGVVAKSGDDKITLENYKREDAIGEPMRILSALEGDFKKLTDQIEQKHNLGALGARARALALVDQMKRMEGRTKGLQIQLDKKITSPESLWFFRMYGPAPADGEEDQTFHGQWAALEENFNPLTLRMSEGADPTFKKQFTDKLELKRKGKSKKKKKMLGQAIQGIGQAETRVDVSRIYRQALQDLTG